jgi:hypothetical protein
MKRTRKKPMTLDRCIEMLRDPTVSDHDAAMAVCDLPNCTDAFKYVVALIWGAGRAERRALSPQGGQQNG